jgi:hypothetical protein
MPGRYLTGQAARRFEGDERFSNSFDALTDRVAVRGKPRVNTDQSGVGIDNIRFRRIEAGVRRAVGHDV